LKCLWRSYRKGTIKREKGSTGADATMEDISPFRLQTGSKYNKVMINRWLLCFVVTSGWCAGVPKIGFRICPLA